MRQNDMTRKTLFRILAFAFVGTTVIVTPTYFYFPRFAISAPPFNARLGKGGERAISFYKGSMYYQKHSFLGIGIPPRKVHWYPSRDAWEWYHRASRRPEGAWAVHLGKDREYGPMAYWYHTEFWIRRVPLWFVGFPLVMLGFAAVTGPRLLVRLYRNVVYRRRIDVGCCGRCGYDLRGNVAGRCPECGEATPATPAGGETGR